MHQYCRPYGVTGNTLRGEGGDKPRPYGNTRTTACGKTLILLPGFSIAPFFSSSVPRAVIQYQGVQRFSP